MEIVGMLARTCTSQNDGLDKKNMMKKCGLGMPARMGSLQTDTKYPLAK